MLALLAVAACAAGAAATAFAAGTSGSSSSGSSAVGGSSASTGSSATGGSQASAASQTRPSSAAAASGSEVSQTGARAVARSGIATWYGPGLYGHKTACGQTLTPALVGVANRTLPCGTLVKVSYGGHSKIVPVLDRGPYAGNGASWDLTAGAADALDITETVRVGTLVVGADPRTP